MNKSLLLFFCCLLSYPLWAQNDSASLSFSGYAEAYYAMDISEASVNERPGFIYNFNRTNELALNLAYIKASYKQSRLRAHMALMTGSYARYNLAAEPAVYRNIYEANIGVKLLERHNLWLDAGVLPSHLGLSNAVGKDWWNLTRLMACEGSPYYETGIRLQYITPNNDWLMALYVLNGWQHIERPYKDPIPAFGTQVTYSPCSHFSVNYSTFLGNEFPDTARQFRFFNNIYTTIQPTSKIGVSLGFDIGFQQQSPNSSSYHQWYTPYMLAKYQLTPKWKVAGRLEYYHDPSEVMVSTLTPNGFQTMGYSVNIDYNLFSTAIWRIEARLFDSEDAIFANNNRQYAAFTTSLAIGF